MKFPVERMSVLGALGLVAVVGWLTCMPFMLEHQAEVRDEEFQREFDAAVAPYPAFETKAEMQAEMLRREQMWVKLAGKR